MNEFLDSIIKRDPAANSKLIVMVAYPGVKAVFFHYIAHRIWKMNFYLIARILSQLSRFLTGIEIHPAAKIGKNLFIDHGMGVVIGETSEVGDNVFIYHGVTLGGLSTKNGKRHPTIGDNVVIGACAQVLGPTRVGSYTKIGSGSVVLQHVPEYSTVIGVPGRVVFSGVAPTQDGADGEESFPDPVAKAIECMLERLPKMEKEIRELRKNYEAVKKSDIDPISVDDKPVSRGS